MRCTGQIQSLSNLTRVKLRLLLRSGHGINKGMQLLTRHNIWQSNLFYKKKNLLHKFTSIWIKSILTDISPKDIFNLFLVVFSFDNELVITVHRPAIKKNIKLKSKELFYTCTKWGTTIYPSFSHVTKLAKRGNV